MLRARTLRFFEKTKVVKSLSQISLRGDLQSRYLTYGCKGISPGLARGVYCHVPLSIERGTRQ